MTQVHYRTCPLCEATCGLAITTEGDRVVSIEGDDQDPFSRGYLCPKGVALADLHHDPDRLRTPMLRTNDTWREATWDEALTFAAERITALQDAHGRDSVGLALGNPTVHNLGLLLFTPLLEGALGSHNRFSSTSLDQLPHMFAALQMFGSPYLMPVPDVDRTDLLVILGANPLVSNGSIMTAPDMRARLRAISARGGKVVVIDPRRTETAARADSHLFIRPGTDAVLLLALCHVLFTEGLVASTRLSPHTTGLVELRGAAASFSPERAAEITGIPAEQIRKLARELATTRRAALYGRLGVCVQEFGGLSAWLCYAVNALCGNLDEEGGLMFTSPAVDLLPLATRLGKGGSYATRQSRVSGYPEFGGEWPMSALAEEIDTPGPGQLRGLITIATNPALSVPNGRRVDRALASLELLVAIDPHLNETTRHAHVILPPLSPLERSHYDLALASYAVRNIAKYSLPVFPPAPGALDDWQICLELWARLGKSGLGKRLGKAAMNRLGPEGLLDFALRTGPRGLRRGPRGLSLRKLRAAPHGIDLGPLESRLPERLGKGPDGHPRKVQLAPPVMLADLPRLEAHLATARTGLLLIGRRDLRSNNSWLHNSERLVKGPVRCTLLIHPDDARPRGLSTGSRATIKSRVGEIEVPVEVTADIMPGVVSVPHGWGHDRPGARLRVAAAHAGASINDLTDDAVVDRLSGASTLAGTPVEVTAASAAASAAARTGS